MLPAKLVEAIKPNDEDDSGVSSSIGAVPSGSLAKTNHNTPDATLTANAPLSENDPFFIEVTSIMEDVELSVGKYIQEMTKTVLQYLGGVKMMSYLGQIFSTGLNFQMSMWQLVMTEAIYLPTVMREQLHQETGTLRLFTEVIPILGPCSVPLPPLPVVYQSTPPVPKETPGTSVSKPSLPLLPDSSQALVKATGLVTMTPMQARPTDGISKQITLLSG